MSHILWSRLRPSVCEIATGCPWALVTMSFGSSFIGSVASGLLDWSFFYYHQSLSPRYFTLICLCVKIPRIKEPIVKLSTILMNIPPCFSLLAACGLRLAYAPLTGHLPMGNNGDCETITAHLGVHSLLGWWFIRALPRTDSACLPHCGS